MSRKRKLFFFALCIFFHSHAFSERRAVTDSSADSSNIYYKSLKLHLDYVEKHLTGGRLPVAGYWNINMEIPSQLAGQLPDHLGHFRISYLNKKEIKARIRRHRSLYLICMSPMTVTDGLQVVGVGDFSISTRRKQIWYDNSGGTTAKFRYDNSKESFELVDLQQGSL